MASKKRKWHSFPDAIYMISYAYTSLDPDHTVEHLLVDASTFLAVEDFAMATIPDGWEVSDIEKTYSYAKMYGGDDGENIDIVLHEDADRNVEFLGVNRHLVQPTTHEAQAVLKRKLHLKKVADLYRENVYDHSRRHNARRAG